MTRTNPSLALGLTLVSLSLSAGCSSGRLSDGDIARFCDLLERCTGTSTVTCEASVRSSRDDAAAAGCSAQLGNAVRCAIRADSCTTTSECQTASDRAQACLAGSSSPDAGLSSDAGFVVPSELRQTDTGMLEIFHDGAWLPICDDGFGMEEADVACRHLGFSGASGYSTVTGTTDSFWLDDVSCSGTEQWLDQCASGGWGSENCTAGESQAVTCF